MKFFIPFVDDEVKAEELILAASKYTFTTIPSPRIYSIEYSHNGKIMDAKVGKYPNNYYLVKEPVLCILGNDNTLYAICTWNRGVARGDPILVSPDRVYSIIPFD